MNKKILFILAIVLIVILLLGQKAQQDKRDISAYIIKVVKEVSFKDPAKGWQKAVPLSTLKSGYEVKTEKGSLALIRFADESKLILREKSIVTIKGEVKGKEIQSRSVHMDRGNMVFNVKKAETEQFRFSSPISVASIRGTEGGYNSGGFVDSLTITHGLADFMNLISGRNGPVGSGQTGTADSSGNFNVGDARDDILNNINNSQNFGDNNGGGSDNGIGVEFGKLKSRHASTIKANLKSFNGKAVNAKLFCRKKNETNFTEINLNIVGQYANGQIPAENIKHPSLEYYLSVSLSDGKNIIIPDNGQNVPAVAAVEAVQQELRIPGQTGSLQKKVIILKWKE